MPIPTHTFFGFFCCLPVCTEYCLVLHSLQFIPIRIGIPSRIVDLLGECGCGEVGVLRLVARPTSASIFRLTMQAAPGIEEKVERVI